MDTHLSFPSFQVARACPVTLVPCWCWLVRMGETVLSSRLLGVGRWIWEEHDCRHLLKAFKVNYLTESGWCGVVNRRALRERIQTECRRGRGGVVDVDRQHN